MATFLLKTEPSEFSYADLLRAKCSRWDGVSNAAALIALRGVKKGDEAFVYHTGDEKAIVGLARAVGDSYEDPENPGLNDRGEPKFAVVDLAPVRAAKSPVTLASMKADGRFASFPLVKQPRLSVMVVPDDLARVLRQLAGL